ncbi:MAG: LLM class flavin-dependent oxidoreductase [Anaerolineae bacterium]
MPDRVALYLQDDFSLQESIDYVKYAEARGFEAVWQAESRFVRDSVVAVAAYAALTTRIKIGMGVVNIYTRHALTIASELLTLDDLAPDRIMGGLGTWYDDIAQQAGIDRGKYLLAMREVLTAVRHLLTLQPVTYRGQFVQINDAQLDVTVGRTEPRRVPLYIGASSFNLLALAGEIADGVLLNYMTSPQYNLLAIRQLENGLNQAGRTIYDIDRPQLVMCSVHPERKVALDAARRVVTQFIMQQPHLMRANDIPQQLIDEITQLHPATLQQIEQAAKLIPDDVVQLVTASGTPEDVRAKVRDYVRAGATCPVLYPLNRNVRGLIDAFASGYSRAPLL